MKTEIGKRYRHYKGGEYTVLALGRLEASPEAVCVVYRAEYETAYGSDSVWIRPLDDFEATLIHEGKSVERFTRID